MDALDNITKIEERLCIKATLAGIPLGGTFELSPACNMSCKMCYARLTDKQIRKEGGLKSGEEWLKIAEEMQKAGTMFLLLTGGEPLLYSDFKYVYRGVRNLGMIVTVNTNGTLITEEWVDFFAKEKPRRINITLYGKNADTYENFCGYREGFDKTIQGIQLLKDAEIDVKLNASITPENVDSVDELYEIAEQLNVPLEIDCYMFPFHNGVDCSYENKLRLNPEECAKMYLKILKREKSQGYITYQNLCEAYRQGKRLQNYETVQCRAGKSSFWINWKGNMMPCFALGHQTEDVSNIGFEKAWIETKKNVQKIQLSKKCSTCVKQELCIVCAGRSYSETGRVDGCPEYLCKMTEEMIK